jgi:hypothetical protein
VRAGHKTELSESFSEIFSGRSSFLRHRMRRIVTQGFHGEKALGGDNKDQKSQADEIRMRERVSPGRVSLKFLS